MFGSEAYNIVYVKSLPVMVSSWLGRIQIPKCVVEAHEPMFNSYLLKNSRDGTPGVDVYQILSKEADLYHAKFKFSLLGANGLGNAEYVCKAPFGTTSNQNDV